MSRSIVRAKTCEHTTRLAYSENSKHTHIQNVRNFGERTREASVHERWVYNHRHKLSVNAIRSQLAWVCDEWCIFWVNIECGAHSSEEKMVCVCVCTCKWADGIAIDRMNYFESYHIECCVSIGMKYGWVSWTQSYNSHSNMVLTVKLATGALTLSRPRSLPPSPPSTHTYIHSPSYTWTRFLYILHTAQHKKLNLNGKFVDLTCIWMATFVANNDDPCRQIMWVCLCSMLGCRRA